MPAQFSNKTITEVTVKSTDQETCDGIICYMNTKPDFFFFLQIFSFLLPIAKATTLNSINYMFWADITF